MHQTPEYCHIEIKFHPIRSGASIRTSLRWILFCSLGLVSTQLFAQAPLAGKRGCFLLFSQRAGRFIEQIGGQNCRDRYVACSTFKVPLAVMAFDSGNLKDETEALRWDGKKEIFPEWERDHTAVTWMKDSVVWFSQRLTPRLGVPRIQAYLADFRYGNQDFSGGITNAWLVAPDDTAPALKISPYEQIAFLRRLYTGKLAVSERSLALTRALLPEETTPLGFSLSGKTGSNFFRAETGTKKRRRLGWFIGRVAKGSDEYFVATLFQDLKPVDETVWGGKRAREITKEFLKQRRLY